MLDRTKQEKAIKVDISKTTVIEVGVKPPLLAFWFDFDKILQIVLDCQSCIEFQRFWALLGRFSSALSLPNQLYTLYEKSDEIPGASAFYKMCILTLWVARVYWKLCSSDQKNITSDERCNGITIYLIKSNTTVKTASIKTSSKCIV